MESYKSYFDRQTVSPQLHEKLLALPRAQQEPLPRPRGYAGRPWKKWAALAACCVLAVGAGFAARLGAPVQVPPEGDTPALTQPAQEGGQGEAGAHSFLVEGPEDEDVLAFYALPAIYYQSVDGQPAVDVAPNRLMLAGSYWVELTKGEVQTIFWGPEGKPEGADGDLPWALSWGGFTLSGSALYDGEGQLLWVTLTGTSAEQELSFTLTLRPGELPFQCGLYSGLETSDAFGVPVTGWSRTEDLNGDGAEDVLCVSEFMAGDVGVRFQVQCISQDDPMNRATLCSTLLVRQALSQDGGVYLGHLLTNGDVPAWREAEFSSLEEARQEGAFAPYLPEQDIPGYGEFYGALSYQEGVRDRLSVHWYRGYDDVSIAVSLPEGELSYALADPDRPEEYDLRLYPIPWSESVPEEYRDTVSMPAFRAEDLSLAVVEARGREHDTGGMTYSFAVLHPSGALVEYRCDGLTAEQVWALAAP